MSDSCIFCKIARREIPAKLVFEDDDCVVFHDINPAAPVHLLLVPKRHIVSLQDVNPDDGAWLGRMLTNVPRLALENGCAPGAEGGFRLVANAGVHGGQEVPHLHFHILGGPRPWQDRAALTA